MKTRMSFLGILAVAALLFVPLRAAAQDAEVDPRPLEFGEVEVGESLTLELTTTSIDSLSVLSISSIEITDDGGGAFEITGTDPDPIPPELEQDQSVVAYVMFSPPGVGSFTGSLRVLCNDHDEPWIEVSLSGEGIEPGEPAPEELMDELLAFFEDAVDSGDLEGTGWNRHMRRARLGIISLKLRLASQFIEWGLDRAACGMLHFVLVRSDAEPWPFDFVRGPAVEEFNSLVADLRDALGCGSGCR